MRHVMVLGYQVPRHTALGIIASLGAIAALVVLAPLGGDFARFWVFGLAFGIVLQRSRFCFTSAFRDLFLLQDGRGMRGVLAGLAIATPGFAIVMSNQIPNPTLGMLPPDANILPLGIHTVVGGVIFGLGMVLAGGCASGSISRMGEGYVASWVALGGMLIGLLGVAYTWNWWWDISIGRGARIWLPAYIGHGASIAVTFAALAGMYLATVWWESRSGLAPQPPALPAAPGVDMAARLRHVAQLVFVRGWPIAIGGAALGLLNVLLYAGAHPWGFTGELSRWVIGAANALQIGPGTLTGADELPGCALELGDGGVLHHMLFLVLGMIGGSFIAAAFAGEFRIRVPRQPARQLQALGGGIAMGYGAGIGLGCTIGAFFSAIPSLGLNGWVFAGCLACGAWLGSRIIAR